MSFDLTPIPQADDLAAQVEALKDALVASATGGSPALTEERYRRTRKALLAHPALGGLVPEYIHKCRNFHDFWPFIKAKFPSYAERRGYIADTLNPILDHLDEVGGTGLGGGFEDQGVIGHGGFGVVHRVHHPLLKMDFAVKYFAPSFEGSGGDGHLERFFQEARMLFSLRHQNIVQIYNAGVVGSRPFIMMEYFDGQPLSQVLRQAGTVPADRAFLLVREVADALAHAHERDILHRDIAPRNILVAKPATFRVIDFGLGVYIEKSLASRMTSAGKAPAGGSYTCPALLADPTLRDPRCDLFSLAAVWFEMLVGRPPVGAGVEQELQRVPQLSNSQRKLILRTLGPISGRSSSARAFLRDLESSTLTPHGA